MAARWTLTMNYNEKRARAKLEALNKEFQRKDLDTHSLAHLVRDLACAINGMNEKAKKK